MSGGNGENIQGIVSTPPQPSAPSAPAAVAPAPAPAPAAPIPAPASAAQCSTYTFPEAITGGSASSAPPRGHGRSVSHGGSSALVGGGGVGGVGGGGGGVGVVGRPSALKSGRSGHQRAFSQGQIADGAGPGRPGHARVESKTDFILPPGHKEPDEAFRASAKGHSRQASRSESIYTLRRSTPPSWWRRLLCFVLRRSPRPEHEDRFRTVVPNHLVPPKTPRNEHPNGLRPNNKVRTTKYTALSFLPRNLLEQFHRVANLYFIFIVLLNWFPAINAFGKEISMIPVALVLGVTAVKDLVEDRRRRASDKRINNSACRIYSSESNRYIKVLWREVRVGDLVHLSNNEVVPADILLLRSSDSGGICYIDTSHLDGETNLKQRNVARGFLEKQNTFEPSKFKSVIDVDAPTTKIYRFHGAIVHPNGERVPVSTENLLLRESLIKNTDFVEGIVLYAGHETKAMLNNGGPRYKRSKLERQMNVDVIWCVLILIVLCVVGAIGCKLWLNAYSNVSEPFVSKGLTIASDTFLTFWTFVIIFQIMIPLSLYVTLELCKILQVFYIHNNVDLYDAASNKRIECRALNITEELGQIQYIFSDKTGTLTENKMVFKRCTIAGVDYDDASKAAAATVEPKARSATSSPALAVNAQLCRDLCGGQVTAEGTQQSHSEKIQEFLLLLAVCNTVVVSHHPHHDAMNASGVIEMMSSTDILDDLEDRPASRDNSKYLRLDESRSVTPSPPLLYVETAPVDRKKANIASNSHQVRKHPANLTDEQKVTISSSSGSSGNCLEPLRPIYEAESPDELALVDCAFAYSCKLLRRTPNLASVLVPNVGVKDYEVLKILPFDSTRKCMSVVLRDPTTKELILFTKGADSSILPNLAPCQDDSDAKAVIQRTQQQLNMYAREGLRVLVMAKRTLTQEEFELWLAEHCQCELAGDNRERRIRDSFMRLETKLSLLGATGIEDRLQEGVPETLASLIAAGIVVWVLTGDKPETAINIAYSAKLFSPQMELLKLMARSKDSAESAIQFYLTGITGSPADKDDNRRALVVDGKTLTFILDRRSNLTKPFLELTRACSSVLCCRATPLQKAYIVKVVKEELKMCTLAIGDGANDVSMIQTADVGIGISGQEGMQAVMAADFSLSRFKFLERLLLVHGHWSYDRLSRMVLYFFYKNAAFVFLIFWYQLYCGFSGSVMIDQMYLMLYNLLFTSLPPLAIGVYDQDAPEAVLLAHPRLYKQGRLGRVYKSYSFWVTIADALYQSVAIFFVAIGAYWDTEVDIWEFGTSVTTACMYVMLLHVAIETRSWTIIHVGSIVCSIGAFYLFSFVYNSFCVDCLGLPSNYWVIQHAISSMNYWLVSILSCVFALLPRMILRVGKILVKPNDVTQTLLSQREVVSQGEAYLVSWSQATCASSIIRAP